MICCDICGRTVSENESATYRYIGKKGVVIRCEDCWTMHQPRKPRITFECGSEGSHKMLLDGGRR